MFRPEDVERGKEFHVLGNALKMSVLLVKGKATISLI
jgi:hypothetical protein